MQQKLLLILVSVLFSFCFQVSAKVRILTFHYNLPEFIELQHKTFQKFLKDDYELIVFNDAQDPQIEEEIYDVCEKYNIRCVRYEQYWHLSDPLNFQIFEWLNNPNIRPRLSFNDGTDILSLAKHPSIRHCHVIQFAMDRFGYNHNDHVAIVDGDLFPIRPFSIKELLTNCNIVGALRHLYKEATEYLWVPFIAFDIQALPNKYNLKFHLSVIETELHDSGSETYNYLRKNPDVGVKKYPVQFSHVARLYSDEQLEDQCGFNQKEIAFIRALQGKMSFQFLIERRFLHFGGSSHEDYPEKIKTMKDFLLSIL